MSAERKKILEMLATGKITAEEAEKLLDKIEGSGRAAAQSAGPDNVSAEKKPRFLRIEVEKPGQDQVNIRVPLAFARSGSRLMAVLPARVNERLAEFGVDLSAFSAMSECDWNEAVEKANIDVSHGNGKKVRIFCE